MKQLALRVMASLAALGLTTIGLFALLAPQELMSQTGLASIGALGFNFVRGDVAASMLVVAFLAGRAVMRGDGQGLAMPLLWAVLVIAGRCLGLFADADGFSAARALVPGLVLALLLAPPFLLMRPNATR
ncbi:hypothetical protein [uncultured Maricaulis sp.]|uniref:hypothetical protein n=1 Tax=uncultured Maricaulis sp. TaxID=174710 RepID=UPI0030DA9431